MPWWGWMVVGAILFGAELFVVEADFYLVFIGASAILTGFLALTMPAVELWIQWLAFAALSLISMVLFRKRVYQILRPGAAGLQDDLVGQVLRVPQRVTPGESCRIEYRGSTWSACNESSAVIEPGARVRIVSVDGIVLKVRAEEEQVG